MDQNNRLSNADGYKLSTPPTAAQIDAVQNRISNYGRDEKINRLENLADRLVSMCDGLKDHSNQAIAIADLVALALDTANDIREING